MTDAIQPSTRIQIRKEFNAQNLHISNISKKVSIFLTQNKEWHTIKNLLIGSVVLLKVNKDIKITPDTFNFILKNTQFNLRFLFWNQNLYRANIVQNFIQNQNKNHLLLLTQLIKKISLTPLLLINPFVKRQN